MYMKSLGNDVDNVFDNTHVRIKIYREFFHGIIYIAMKDVMLEFKIFFFILILYQLETIVYLSCLIVSSGISDMFQKLSACSRS